ncbi:glutathione S-transferase theta-1-like isoform X1 [Haliotis rufescens]|uniref:glutathione S-transferase theta-1-like isoform X1 n=1 Tax=Haliotis rufescens TaxID=6454 RepID=UPI00201F5A29|nr:glutathione S-transferase theta-1-like isoform X1 [Haliotis rufescens]
MSQAKMPGQTATMNGDAHREKNSRPPVELYIVRISPPCRLVWWYMLQYEIPHVLIDVDFTQGETNLPDVVRKQPHQEVPILLDGDVVVFDGPAILHYLAAQFADHAGFGISLSTRMMSESLISWANSELHRVVGYGYVYPQFLEKYALSGEEANEVLVEKGLHYITRHLEVLENRYLAKHKYLTGDRHTVADVFVATVLLQLQWPNFQFRIWPKVDTWLSRVKQVEFWDIVHVSHREFLQELERNRYTFD